MSRSKASNARREFMETVLREAQELLLEGYSPNPGIDERRNELLNIKSKSSFSDLVTIYDQKVEDFLIARIKDAYPGEAIIGEESAPAKEELRATADGFDAFWLLDPIDGTTNYARAYPFFSSTMAWVERIDGHFVVQAGATFNPLTREMFSASRGMGASLNGERISCSSVDDSRQALMATGFAALRKGSSQDVFDSFEKMTSNSLGVRRDGSAALDLAYVACGRLDLYWETGLSPWDMAAGVLLVEEAGGKVSSSSGKSWDMFAGDIVSSNAQLHHWALDSLR